MIVFDRQLRFVLTAGQALERMGDPEICREGNYVADAFPAEFWERFEPLFSSALEGETRTREVWTADERHCLMVDAGPLCSDGGRCQPMTARTSTAASPWCSTSPRAAAPTCWRRRRTDGFEEVFEHAPIGTGLLDSERPLAARQPRALRDHRLHLRRADRQALRRHHAPGGRGNDTVERRRCGPARSPPTRSRSATSTPPARPSRRSSRCRSCATATARRCTTSPSCRTSRRARSSRSSSCSLADHDPLTGLRNRRLFEHDLRLQLGRCQRYGETAGLMVIDLDGFRAAQPPATAATSATRRCRRSRAR